MGRLRLHRDTLAGVVLIALAVAYYVASRDLPPGRDEPGPAFLPALLSGALFLLGLVLGCSGGAGGSELPPARPLDGRSIATTAAAMAATILYAVLFPVLGFAVSTWLYTLSLTLLFGRRRRWVLMAAPLLATLLIYLLFDLGLGARLPPGRLW